VARRARPFHVSKKSGENHVLVEARHDGYSRLSVSALHRRIFAWEKGVFWLVVDQVIGNGVVSAANHIHLHPNVKPDKMDSYRWRLKGLPFSLYIQAFGNQGADIVSGQIEPYLQGWYSEQFGIRSPNPVISLHTKAALPMMFGYLLTFENSISIETKGFRNSGTEVRIESGSQIYKLSIDADEVKYIA
jgi:hypothetical protein